MATRRYTTESGDYRCPLCSGVCVVEENIQDRWVRIHCMACNENQQMSLNDFYVNQVGWTARWHQEDLSFRPHDYRPDRQIPLPREARVEQDESPTFRLMVEYLPSGEPAFRVVATREPVVAEEVKAAGADTAERPAQARKIRLRPLGK